MAGQIGNRHTYKASEYAVLTSSPHFPKTRQVAVDQAKMHPSGGALAVVVVQPNGDRQDMTTDFLTR